MSNVITQNWFKVIGIVFLLLALGNHPYSYYQILRWVILIIGVYCSYFYYQHHKVGWAWVFGIMALLFNPIIPFYLSKDTWQFIDLVAAIIFFVSLFKTPKIEKNT